MCVSMQSKMAAAAMIVICFLFGRISIVWLQERRRMRQRRWRARILAMRIWSASFYHSQEEELDDDDDEPTMNIKHCRFQTASNSLLHWYCLRISCCNLVRSLWYKWQKVALFKRKFLFYYSSSRAEIVYVRPNGLALYRSCHQQVHC